LRFISCFGEIQHSGISRAKVRALFPVTEKWIGIRLLAGPLQPKNSCKSGLTPAAPKIEMLKALYVDRPCGDLRPLEAILSVLQMGPVVIFWPGGPPVLANASLAADLQKT
jgi:hypothetical protein